MADVLRDSATLSQVSDLQAAVLAARTYAKPGDIVLFAPACASFDMFNNFEHRGDVFCRIVAAL